MAMQDTREPEAPKKGRRTPQRTCVGCGQAVDVDGLIRIVVGPAQAEGGEGRAQGPEVAVDLAHHGWGRGAYVHPLPACLDTAARRGLSRAFKTQIRIEPSSLRKLVLEAAQRRVTGLVLSAVRSGRASCGREAVQSALAHQDIRILLVASDVADKDKVFWLKEALVSGLAMTWGTKASLGALVGRDEVSMIGIRNAHVGAAIVDVCRVADGARAGAEVR